jgi:hypothetical protein
MGTPLSDDCNARRWALQSFDLRWPRWRLCKPRARALGIAMAHFQYFGRLICTFAVPGHLSGAGWSLPASDSFVVLPQQLRHVQHLLRYLGQLHAFVHRRFA